MTVTTLQGRRRLDLIEHVTTRHPRAAMTEAQGLVLLQRFGQHVDVEFPTPRTHWQWALTPRGWVGAFAVDASLTVVSRPKLPVANLARMLGVVYDLPVESFPELVACATLPDLYDQLARMLAGAAMTLVQQGLHHAYRPVEERRAAARGRIVTREAMRATVDPRLLCRFTERTANVLENQLILWTLGRVLRSGLCQERTQQVLRETYRPFLGAAVPTPVTAGDCDRVRYDRLTERYRRAHALCRLFLENSAPTAEAGEEATLPFLLHMPSLFERFVTRWLGRHLLAAGGAYRVVAQERNVVGRSEGVGFSIDIVVYDQANRALCVLDTKYKLDTTPAASDVAQVGYYALLKGCTVAGLVYPASSTRIWEGMSGPVATFGAPFGLTDDLDSAGRRLVTYVMQRLAGVAPSRASVAMG